MRNIIMSAFLLFSVPCFACEKDVDRIYFEYDGHKYLHVTGYCRGKIEYIVHLQECICNKGLYEVKGDLYEH